MIQADRRPTTRKPPARPGDLQHGVLNIPLHFTRLIGAGGMGEVWEASSDDLPGHRFAIKVVALAYVQNAEAIARFFGEARAASAIDDPNIVMVHGTGRTDDGRPALVMPYIEGKSLADVCEERGPLPLDAVVKILLQTASALRAAHSRQITHRDIKLQNVMITHRWGREWFVILVDFGIAKFHDAELAREIHTNTKQYIGTPGYSAPEQILGKQVTEKADMYSLGVLAYRILCGRAPYVTENPMELMNLQLNGAPFPQPRELRPDIPPEWNEAILACLQHDPTRRPTASEFAKRIAAGVQNGSSLLHSLAPRIAFEARNTASEVTLSNDVSTALSQLDAQMRQRRRRLPTFAALAIGACAGVVSTGIAFRVASRHDDAPMHGSAPAAAASPVEATRRDARPADESAITASPPSVAPPQALRADTVAAVVPRDAGAIAVFPRAVATPAEPPAATARSVDAGPAPPPRSAALAGPLDAGAEASRPPATAARLDAGVDAMLPLAGGDTPKPDPPQRTVEKRPQTAGQQGTLHVEVEPWADVVIGDWQDTTPVTRKLPAGHHRVVLKKGSRTEAIDVTITPNQTTTVTRSW